MSNYIKQMRASGKFPAVLRYERMGRAELRKMIKHAKPDVRKKLAHIDSSRTHLNRTPVGSLDDLERLFEVTEEMAKFNRQSNELGLRAICRSTEADAVKTGPLKEPWDAKALPWRQAILSVHHEWAAAADDCPAEHILEYIGSEGEVVRLDKRKGLELEEAMKVWLTEEHSDDLIYMRADWDEQGFHFHAAVASQYEYEPTGRYAEGRWHWKPSVHRFFRNECDAKGKKLRSGYELAQDSIGEWFARPEYRHMNIVRGEPRAKMCRDALDAVADLVAEDEADALFDSLDIPSGSENAKVMFALKKRISEAVDAKGDAGKVRKDDTQKMAIDWLELLGVISADEKHEASTRRARQALLEKHAEAFGSATDIIRDPNASAEIVAARISAEKQAVDRARKEADERAAKERARLDREAAERRRKADNERKKQIEAENAQREKEHAARTTELDEREAGLKRYARQLGEFRDRLLTAAKECGLLDHPAMRKGLEFAQKIGLATKRNTVKVGEDPRD